MTVRIYQFQRGEPVTISLVLVASDAGDDPAALTVTAALKPCPANSLTVPLESVAVVANFAPTFVAATADAAAHWLLTLTAVDTAALDEGRYITDAKIALGGVVIERTEPAIVVLKGHVTP